MISYIKKLLYQRVRTRRLNPEMIDGLRRSQDLAYQCAREISRQMKEGWTEFETARLMDCYLADHGVRNHFHKSFAWFGDRTRFDGVDRLIDFLPTMRALRPGDAVILDTAPVFRGFPADIGYCCSFGPNQDVAAGKEFLRKLREEIPKMFAQPESSGGKICDTVVERIRQEGYDVIHHRYPGAVLGHRLHPMPETWRPPTLIPFSWHALEKFLIEGVVPDLLNEAHEGDLRGAWAIEPHFGGKGFGCKFEEVLILDERGARWLSAENLWQS